MWYSPYRNKRTSAMLPRMASSPWIFYGESELKPIVYNTTGKAGVHISSPNLAIPL
jgi:hypothetical protein